MRRSSAPASILHRLRHVMADTMHTKILLNGYIVPTEDAHQNEYVAASDKRVAFVCGFTGNHGTAVITKEKAALWTDSRYFVQASRELHHHWILMKEGAPDEVTIAEWLKQFLPAGGTIGIDPLYISSERWDFLEKNLEQEGFHLMAVEENLVDLIWTDRPAPPSSTIYPLEINYSGKLWVEKIAEVREQMKQVFAAMLVVTALDEVAWLLNLRGSDIEYNPVFYGYIILTMTSILLFANSKKLSPEATIHLGSTVDVNSVVVLHTYTNVKKYINSLSKTIEGKISISKTSSYALSSLVPRNRRILLEDSLIAPMKAVKNTGEIFGLREAHIKDAIALCDFWAWIEKEIPKGSVTEPAAARKVLHYMKQQTDFVGPSFGVITRSGPNSAIPYYEATPETDRPVAESELFLCESGSQYKDGTTDITRVFHFGTPTAHEKECFTAVLKGHIALASIIFPPYTKGFMVDSLARAALWDLGLDFMHAAGHGIGAFLNVNEGPTHLEPKFNTHDPGLQAGMTITNEPGYYEEGKFGVRIENVMLVKKVLTKFKEDFDENTYLAFEILSLVPIQTKMINVSMLGKNEIEWVNNYHRQCRDVIGPLLLAKGRSAAHEWLMKETEPIG